jgi:acyl-CoA synthetase (AMP-forming)/AMP-acid ligase II
VVLLNYLLPRDVLKAMEREKVTGLTAVPPLYIQLAQLEWPPEIDEHLRYFANTGGRMPRETLNALRQRVPSAKPFLMYGLTEAFRSPTCPRRGGPPARFASARPYRMPRSWCCARTAANVRPTSPANWCTAVPWWARATGATPRRRPSATSCCLRAWAGARRACNCPSTPCFRRHRARDAEGFLYFIGRRDEMIKTSGYRVSPTEVEEVLYATQLVGECVAFGVDHPTLGQAIQVIATPPTARRRWTCRTAG